MKFIQVKRGVESKLSGRSICYLAFNNWDDFGFKTTFQSVLFDETGARFDLGFVRIMEFDMKGGVVNLDREFEFLEAKYCSLANDRKYYEKLMRVSIKTRRSYLKAIRDCAFDNSIWETFKDQHAMRASLLREVSPSDVQYTFPRILKGATELTPYDFHFEFSTKGGEGKERCEFSVRPNSKPPSNIHVLIGRNGVGKTRLLAGMADALTENKAASIGVVGNFAFQSTKATPNEFLNLVIVSYSAFDRFDPILTGTERTEHSVPYYYIGIKAREEDSKNSPRRGGEPRVLLKSSARMDEEFREAIEIIVSDPNRFERWANSMQILASDPGIRELEIEQHINDSFEGLIDHLAERFSVLSSGHKIVLLTITKLVEVVSDRSLVLLDEPETHLHPPLLGSFIRALSELLSSRNAVAIVATHSPVVLQEVPSSCVSFLNRSGETLRVSRPDVETFAENVGALTRKVFGLEVDQSGFYKLLKDSAVGRDFEDVMAAFDDKIGGEGRALTRAFTTK
jgi:predicted ATPase